jgi:mono/diheme cytochrome c family protein
MKNIYKIGLLGILMVVASCQNDKKPNYQYMPNMYESVGYEAYSKHEIFEPVTGGSSAMEPAAGSVARGWLPYEIENNPEGYAFAKANLSNPTRYTEDRAAKGEELYNIYCGICHGKKGDGQGTLVKREKILGVPAYNDVGRAITEGSVYHVMYYGINSMGSYASQMTEDELWMVDHYVMSLKNKLDGKEALPFDVVKEVAEIEVVETHGEEVDHGDEH